MGEGTGEEAVAYGSVCMMPDELPGGYLVYRAEGRGQILAANQTLLALVGCASQAELLALCGGTFEGLVHPDDIDNLRLDLESQLASGPSARLSYRLRTATGDFAEVEDVRRLAEGLQDGPVYYAILSRRDWRYEQVGADRLTGLPQRDRLLAYVDHLAASAADEGFATPMGLAYLNIRGFRTFNALVGRSRADQALVDEAHLLREAFPHDYLARLQADRFVVVAPSESLVDGVDEVRLRLGSTLEEGSLDIKMGVYQLAPGDDAALALDRAMVACNTLSRMADAWYYRWRPSLEKSLDMNAFASLHIREALESGAVEVFYQPVVRALTGELCGTEALARWRDPERGLIPPGAFIGALEASGQVVMLDTYILDHVCRGLRDRMDAGRSVVPVSVNLSRLDFTLCDVPAMVEHTMETYELPRDLVHVEVTESALAGDEGTVYGAMERLRAMGYEVWMDDFGSGYSTLNLLKDYAFDTIKLDLMFLSTMDDRSRAVVRHIISMAKELGVDTLAEGVETQEQVAFLRDIGCDRLQGYFYGKPQPEDELERSLAERGIRRESRGWRGYRDAVGSIDFLTDVPLAIMEVGDGWLSIPYENGAYRRALDEVGRDDMAAAVWAAEPGGAPTDSFRRFADSVVEAGGAERQLFYTVGGRYVRFAASCVATAHGQSALRVSIVNLTEEEEVRESRVLDRTLRQVFRLYDRVSIIEPDADRSTVVYAGRPFPGMGEGCLVGLEGVVSQFASAVVYPEDAVRYREFCDPATLGTRVRAAGGWVAGYFRMRDLYGEYTWKVVTMLGVESEGRVAKVISLIKDADLERGETARALMQSFAADAGVAESSDGIDDGLLWRNLMLQGDTKYFWKDDQRRFLGASRSFLEFYGLSSPDEILGKTDEDMHWHVNDVPYRDEERDVLEWGKASRGVLGSCIVRGQLHRIRATKVPLYRGGRIVGLLGFFEDAEVEGERRDSLWRASMTDPVTGTFNLRGLWSASGEYAEERRVHGGHFAAIIVRIRHYGRFVDDYGDQVGETLLVEVAKTIRGLVGVTATVGRVSDGSFVVFTKYEDEAAVLATAEKVRQAIASIHDAGGTPCTVRPQVETMLDDVGMGTVLRRLADLR